MLHPRRDASRFCSAAKPGAPARSRPAPGEANRRPLARSFQTSAIPHESERDLCCIDEEKSFGGYLFKIARNKIYNRLRKKINEKVYLDYIINNNRQMWSEDGGGYESKQLVERIEDLINSLPDRRKDIFLLSRDKGLTYKEIATLLNISENTVDTQIRNALDFLRDRLAKFR